VVDEVVGTATIRPDPLNCTESTAAYTSVSVNL
jgi:hypothetical protein